MRPRRRWRRLAILAGLLVLLGGLFEFAPPLGLEWGVVRTLTGLGMEKVLVNGTDLRLFGGKLVLRGLLAQNRQAPEFGLKGLDVFFHWRPLLSRTVSLSDVQIEGLSLDLIQQADGSLQINGLRLPSAGGTAVADPAHPPWGLALQGFHVRDTSIRYHQPNGVVVAQIERLDLDALNTAAPEQPIHLSLKLRLQDHPITLDGEMTPLAAQPAAHFHLSFDGVDMARLAPLLPVKGLQGVLTGVLEVILALPHPETPVIHLKGQVTGQHLAWPSVGQLGELAALGIELQWDGPTHRADVQLTAPLVLTHIADHDGNGCATCRLTEAAVQWDNGTQSLTGHVQAQMTGLQAAGGRIETLSLSLKEIAVSLAQKSYRLSGEITSEGLSGAASDVSVAARHLAITFPEVSYTPEALLWTGELNGDGLSAQQSQMRYEQAALRWSGVIKGAGRNGTLKTLSLNGALTGQAIHWAQPEIRAAVEAFDGRGTASIALDGSGWPQLQAALHLGQVAVDDGARQEIAAVDQLDLVDLRMVPSGMITAQTIQAQKIKAWQKQGRGGYPWRLELGTLRMDHPSLAGASLALTANSVDLVDLTGHLTRSQNGEIVGVPKPSPKEKHNLAAAAAPPPLRIGRIGVSGRNHLLFQDQSLATPLKLDLTQIQGTISNLDSQHTDRDSPFEMAAQLADAHLAVRGTVRPWLRLPEASASLSLKAMELPPLSPYSRDALGLDVKTGHLDASATFNIAQGQLSGQTELTATHLDIVEPNGPTALAQHTGMPVQTALGLLRDDQDRIHLTIPVSGDLTAPRFDISDAIAQTVGGALKSTALTTLKILFPVAALIEAATDQAGTPSLEPIVFAPGSAMISPTARERLATVGQLLRERPQLGVTLCGIAVAPQDWPPLYEAKRHDEAGVFYSLGKALSLVAKPGEEGAKPDPERLQQLAAQRADAVKAALIADQKIGVERLYSCRPEIETTSESQPRVHLGL